MRLVVNVLAYNEEATAASVVRTVPRDIPGIDETIVQVIDDGSRDRTAETARLAGADVVSHPRNMGVGTAFQTGVRTALARGADIMVNIDGDGQFDATQIPDLIRPILEGRADFTTCSRFLSPDLIPEMPKAKLLGNHAFAWVIGKLVRQRFTDVSCGFRAFSRDALLRLSLRENFTHTHEVFLDLGIRGLRIVEIPLKVRGVRQHGHSRVARNLFNYGARTMKIIMRAYRDYRPLRFFGTPAILFSLAGMAMMAYGVINFLMTEIWVKWASFTGAFLFSIGMVLALVAIIADMLDRIRFGLEELLYMERLRYYESKKDAAPASFESRIAESGADAKAPRGPVAGREEICTTKHN
jgi:glycosyltransferase involved in cell wall biosynthesis